ncbi:MAG: carboxypeptidase-like regulatory domain-containing protein [Gemmatimonadaceae bacterium]
MQSTKRLALAARSFVALALGLCLARASSAQAPQVLRGVVRDSATRQAIPGVVLILTDAGGRALGRNITGGDGRYAIALVPEIRRMRLLRIGFRPRDVPVPADASVELDVSMLSIPTLLSAVNVVDAPTCPHRDDRASAFALWEQAKAALTATVVARETNPPEVIRLHYERRLDDGDQIVAQSVRVDSASTGRPWVAPQSAAAFVETGFSSDSARSRWFGGPDADVMIDDAFARGYCFHIAAPDTSQPRAIGLGFERSERKRGHVDIEGTVWIDSVSRSLISVVFHYVGLDRREERVRPGGRIDFRVMQNGATMIDRWYLRFPATNPNAALGSLEARESGGEVAHARWRDGREWQASLGTLRGHIPGKSPGGTVVRLLDTDYATTADSSGNFTIRNLLPGPYSIGAINGRLADLGLVMKPLDAFTAMRDSVVLVSPAVPSAASYVAGKCGADSPKYALLAARVLTPEGFAGRDAHIVVRGWFDGTLERVVEGDADENGLFFACRTPRDIPVQIIAELDGAVLELVLDGVTTDIVAAKMRLIKRRRP